MLEVVRWVNDGTITHDICTCAVMSSHFYDSDLGSCYNDLGYHCAVVTIVAFVISLVGLMMSLPVMTPSTLMSVCTDAITRE
jgi:uncharacterized membrane protein